MSKSPMACVERRILRRHVDERPAGEPLQRRERQVGPEVLLQQQAFALAVFRQVDDAGRHRVARVAKRDIAVRRE